MKLLKATIAAAALLTCLSGNDYPAKSQEIGCDPIGTGYRVKTAEIRLNSYLN